MTEVKSCGCRYKDSYCQYCEYLCEKHKDEFILKQFNSELELRIYAEKFGRGL